MKVLIVNKFLYPKGGDAIVALNTGGLLASHSHEVAYWGMQSPKNFSFQYSELFVKEVDLEATQGLDAKIRAVRNILCSFESAEKLKKVIEQFKPDIVHLHNFSHQISPSILPVLKKARIPAVMTMHDYKMVCGSYQLLAAGAPCEACSNGKHLNAFFRKCVKGSTAKSAITSLEMVLHHNIWDIYSSIHTFIAPSRFMGDKVLQMGFKGHVECLPNFYIGARATSIASSQGYILYCGRLTKEKGLLTLLSAIKGTGLKLKIVGDGPLREVMEARITTDKLHEVELLGYRQGEDLKRLIQECLFAVLPSEWYENSPLSVIEAFAAGKPVLGARIGGIPELVHDGITGYTFEAGNHLDLQSKLLKLAGDNSAIRRMGIAAQKYVAEKLNSEIHYEALMKIYNQAISAA